MNPPKCRICGMREHNHRCQGGTPAMQVAEQRRLKREARPMDDGTVGPANHPPPGGLAGLPLPETVHLTLDQQRVMAKALRRSTRPRWHDDSDAAGELTEVRDTSHRPARFYAPPGQCVYCDRRREAARRSMASVRERGTDA